jgi:hypothetical protein
MCKALNTQSLQYLQKDPTNSEKEAVEHIYRQLRNAEPPDEETARGISTSYSLVSSAITLAKLVVTD